MAESSDIHSDVLEDQERAVFEPCVRSDTIVASTPSLRYHTPRNTASIQPPHEAHIHDAYNSPVTSGTTSCDNSNQQQCLTRQPRPNALLENVTQYNATQPEASHGRYVRWTNGLRLFDSGSSSRPLLPVSIDRVDVLSFLSAVSLCIPVVYVLYLEFSGSVLFAKFTYWPVLILTSLLLFLYVIHCFIFFMFYKRLEGNHFHPLAIYFMFIFVVSCSFAIVHLFVHFLRFRGHCPIPPNALLSTTAPQVLHECPSRVAPVQAPLFSETIYQLQFLEIQTAYNNYTDESVCELTSIREDLLSNVQSNTTLCGQGFEGNSDLYGLGVRVGIYVQWVASLLANNLLPNSKNKFQGAWLLFALALCITAYVSSFRTSCVFSIEIEILYWLFWGGCMCVFASAPSRARLGSSKSWVSLDWTVTIQYITISLMAYHNIWFFLYATRNVFPRMPCGTYHLFLIPVKIPRRVYAILESIISILFFTGLFVLVYSIPIVGLLFMAEAKASIQSSATYRMFFPGPPSADDDDPVDLDISETPLTRLSFTQRVAIRLERSSRRIVSVYRSVRVTFGLPPESRQGIRLITPMEMEPLGFTLPEALEHAFNQPDDDFLTNDGAFESVLESGLNGVDCVAGRQQVA